MRIDFKKSLIIIGLIVGLFSLFGFLDVINNFDYSSLDFIRLFAQMTNPVIGLGVAAILVIIGIKYKD